MIKIYCGKARTKLLQLERVVAGRVGMPVEFSFSEEWNGLEKTAVFRGRSTAEKILPGTITTVAPEAVEEPGYELQIGVYGKSQDGQIVIPTTWTTVCTIEEGCIDPDAEESVEPTPSIVAQIQAMAEEAASNTAGTLTAARNAETKATTALTYATQAVKIATAESESAYASATEAQSAKNAAEAAKTDAALSATAAENSKTGAYTALTLATQKADSIQGMTATVQTGAAGSSATVTVTGGTSGTPYSLNFTIPKGDDGETYDDTEIREDLEKIQSDIDELGTGKQDKLIAGENITIAEDGKTISATGGSSFPEEGEDGDILTKDGDSAVWTSKASLIDDIIEALPWYANGVEF